MHIVGLAKVYVLHHTQVSGASKQFL